MRHNHIERYLRFFELLYEHLDGVDYVPGVAMLFKALPIKLQAHILEVNHDDKLPDPDVFYGL